MKFITSEDGKKTAVVLPIEDYEKLMEDIDDLAALAERREEPSVSHSEMLSELKRVRKGGRRISHQPHQDTKKRSGEGGCRKR